MARGAAMLFVCLAHFSGAYLAPRGVKGSELLIIVSMVASPSFMIISGTTTGFLAVMYSQTLPYLRRRLLDRGLFMLLAGHLILAIAVAGRAGGLGAAYRTSFITDPIAIAIMIGPRLVGATRMRTRALLSICLYVVGWMLVLFWHPIGYAGWSIKPYLTGSIGPESTGSSALTFPLLQWLAVYLCGSIIGEAVGRLSRSEPERARNVFLQAAYLSTITGLALYLGAKNLGGVHIGILQALMAAHLTSPTQKFPPGPVYLLFFGGCGLGVMWLVLRLEAQRRFPWPLVLLQRLGQASLIVYLAQAFVYSSVIRAITSPYTPWWPVLLLATIGFLLVLATLWCRIDGNRFLTIGLTSMLERQSKRESAAIAADLLERAAV